MARKKEFSTLNTCLLVLLLAVILFGTYSVIRMQTAPQKETAPLPKIEITLISVSNCENCLDVKQIENFVKTLTTVNLTKTTTLDETQASELIKKYSITKLPAAVITGETTNLTIENFEQRNNDLVFDKTPAPYYDTSTQLITGKVSAILVTDKSCTKCTNVSMIIDQLRQTGVWITSAKTLDAGTSEAKKLIDKYKIQKVPTAIFSQEATEYDIFKRLWSQIGTIETDGMLVMRNPNPPYKELSSNKTKGIVSITYIADKSCQNCTNATVFKEILQTNLGMSIAKEKEIDIATTEGKKTTVQYNITKVPTVILSTDAGDYPSFDDVWTQVGTKEKDGTYVFRDLAAVAGFKYKDLTSKQELSAGESTD